MGQLEPEAGSFVLLQVAELPFTSAFLNSSENAFVVGLSCGDQVVEGFCQFVGSSGDCGGSSSRVRIRRK